MLRFVNAKINLGLQIVRRRPDGYHDLQTLFYPIGARAGSPSNPEPFCDILEITRQPADAPFRLQLEGQPADTYSCLQPSDTPFRLQLEGRPVDCPLEKNLVYRAAAAFFDTISAHRSHNSNADQEEDPIYRDGAGALIRLRKVIPDGAGIGGGSADAAFTLRTLNDLYGAPCSEAELQRIALILGADCPFFLINSPAYAEGVGERLQPVPLRLDGLWLLLIKPDIHISTRQAFAGVTPRPGNCDLARLDQIPIGEWRHCVHNDFEDSLFPQFPVLAEIKSLLYRLGAIYTSLTGSGSCLYGIFPGREAARFARAELLAYPSETLRSTNLTPYLLQL